MIVEPSTPASAAEVPSDAVAEVALLKQQLACSLGSPSADNFGRGNSAEFVRGRDQRDQKARDSMGKRQIKRGEEERICECAWRIQ